MIEGAWLRSVLTQAVIMGSFDVVVFYNLPQRFKKNIFLDHFSILALYMYYSLGKGSA